MRCQVADAVLEIQSRRRRLPKAGHTTFDIRLWRHPGERHGPASHCAGGRADRAGSQSAQRAEDQAFDQDVPLPQVAALSRHGAEFPPGEDGTLR